MLNRLSGAIFLASFFLPFQAQAQNIVGTHEQVALDSPEGWAMAYMTAASLNLSPAAPQDMNMGEIRLSAEVGSIPSLNEDQQRVGFGGFKSEDLNKSPVFGRARAGLGLPLNFTLELSWTPPIEIDGAEPEGIWGIALSRPLLEIASWNLGARLYALRGDVTGDITCSRAVANQPPGSAENPLSCVAPSNDRLELNHYGGELILARNFGQRWQSWLTVANTRMDPFIQVSAQVLGTLDLSTLDTEGTTQTYSVGTAFQLAANWRVTLGSSYTPLEVERPGNNPGGQDNFWNVRLGLIWDL